MGSAHRLDRVRKRFGLEEFSEREVVRDADVPAGRGKCVEAGADAGVVESDVGDQPRTLSSVWNTYANGLSVSAAWLACVVSFHAD